MESPINLKILKMRIDDVTEARQRREADRGPVAALAVQVREQQLAGYVMGVAPELLALLATADKPAPG